MRLVQVLAQGSRVLFVRAYDGVELFRCRLHVLSVFGFFLVPASVGAAVAFEAATLVEVKEGSPQFV